MLEEKIKELENLVKIQRSPGNYNCNEYMYGMLIGLECALACLKNEDAVYTEKPTEWLDDNKSERLFGTHIKQVIDAFKK